MVNLDNATLIEDTRLKELRDLLGMTDDEIIDKVRECDEKVLLAYKDTYFRNSCEGLPIECLCMIVTNDLTTSGMWRYRWDDEVLAFLEKGRVYFVFENHVWRFNEPLETVYVHGRFRGTGICPVSFTGRGLFGSPKDKKWSFEFLLDARHGIIMLYDWRFIKGIEIDDEVTKRIKRDLLFN